MSLILKFPANICLPHPTAVASREVTFHQSDSVRIMPPGIVVVVDLTEEILDEGYWDDAYCFKGRVSLPNEPSCEVLVKMACNENTYIYAQTVQDYIREAKFYQDHLCGNSSFYGKGVPRTYGCYETKFFLDSRHGKIPIDSACVVFQYPGISDLEWSTGADLTEFGVQAVELLLDLHKSGIMHGSLGLGANITCLDGKPFFVNFFQARKHICRNKPEDFKRPIRLADIYLSNVKCPELGDFFEELREHVTPRRYHWYGYDVDYHEVDSLQDIFQQSRRSSFGSDVPVEIQWEYAVEVWKFLCANWSAYHGGEAPEVGDTSFEVYKAKHGLNIIYEDPTYDDD